MYFKNIKDIKNSKTNRLNKRNTTLLQKIKLKAV